MSNALRNFQKRKSTKPRRRLNTRGTKKGPASVPRAKPLPRIVPVPDGPPDLTKANPSCRRCHGTGWGATVVQIDHDTKREHCIKVICICVSRGMAGGVPWLRKGY